MPRPHGLLFNYDCTEFFYRTPPDVIGPQAIDAFVGRMAEAGVGVLLINTNAQRTNYRSDVWEPFWTGYDPTAGDDQPVLAHLPKNRIAMTRNLLDSMMALARQGVDYPAAMITACRRHGISPWISLRMNDVHDVHLANSPLLSSFWKSHRQWQRQPDAPPGTWHAHALDYARPQVRAHYMALIRESVTRFDPDGLELDFMRWPYLFRPGHEAEGAEILTRWLRKVRKVVDQAAARHGHAIRLGVRVPALPEAAEGLGFRPALWAREGLIDLLVVAPFFTTCDFDIPIERWRQQLGDAAVVLAGGLEVRLQPYPGAQARTIRPEEARGAAANVLADGADAVYLFNYFEWVYRHGAWPRAEYFRTLRAMGSLDELLRLPRTHVVTFHDTVPPGQPLRHCLPAVGTNISVRLRTGPPPQRPAWVVVRFDKPPAAAPRILVDGTVLEDVKLDGATAVASVPERTIRGRAVTVQITRGQDKPAVVWLSLEVPDAAE